MRAHARARSSHVTKKLQLYNYNLKNYNFTIINLQLQFYNYNFINTILQVQFTSFAQPHGKCLLLFKLLIYIFMQMFSQVYIIL
jgi:hypothetical protein